MNIPFSQTVGIKNGSLENHEGVQNHIGSMHAGAQFTLAESASGVYLSSLVPELEGKIVPLLRESSVKYKKVALGRVHTEVFVDEKDVEKFKLQFEAKGRATIIAKVILKDEEGDVTCEGSFKWFVQSGE